MASLIDSLIDILDSENTEYEKMLDISMEKTDAIVNSDIDRLHDILVKEQAQIDVLDKLELQRRNNVGDICKVLNLSPEGIRVNDIIEILRKRPKEHDALSEVHMKLKKTIDSLVKINENNKSLLKESMDMIEFEMNLAKSIILGPQTNNYDNAAYEQGSASVSGRFDAKQ